MDPVVTAFVGIAILATSNALPIGGDVGEIEAPTPGLNELWSKDVVIEDNPLTLVFGFEKDGSFSASFKLDSKFRGKSLPLTAGVSAHPSDVRKTLKFQVGMRIMDAIAGVLHIDRTGYKWLSSFWMPVKSQGGIEAMGASLEGEGTRPTAISGGVGIRNNLYQGRITLDKNLTPEGTSVVIIPSYR